MKKEKVALLKAEIRSQIGIIDEIYKEIEKRASGIEMSQERTESLSYHLHNLYCAFEDMFLMIADFFENEIAEKAGYHKYLLLRMSVEIEGVRPPVISKETMRLLDNLRAFRHLFRHAYGYRLENSKVKMVLEVALKLKGVWKEEIEGFIGSFG